MHGHLGVDPNQTYSMEEVIEMVKEQMPAGTDVTSSMVAGMLRLGTAVNPQEDDLKFYNQFSKEYAAFLKNENFSIENLDPEPAKDGSFELWAYYHLGVPSFSMRLFSAPKVKATAKAEEKKQAETKAEDAEKEKKKELKVELIEKEKALLAWSEKEWNGKGFVEWQKIQHPQLGEVEIGGFIPYLETTPKPERIDSLLNAQLPWLLQLSKKMPDIKLGENKLTDLGAGVYKLELFVENRGYLPYPIGMGQWNSHPAPVVVLLEGEIELLEGISRTPLGFIGGNQVKKLTWLLKAKKGSEITAKTESAVFGTDVQQIKIGG